MDETYIQSEIPLDLPINYESHSLDEILQLADSMLVLDKGKVLINGHLQAVWDSAEMRPWLPEKEQYSLLMATVTVSMKAIA